MTTRFFDEGDGDLVRSKSGAVKTPEQIQADKRLADDRRRATAAESDRKAKRREEIARQAAQRAKVAAENKAVLARARARQEKLKRKQEAERLEAKGRPEDKTATVSVGGEGEGFRSATATERESERLRTETVVIRSLSKQVDRSSKTAENKVATASKSAQKRINEAQEKEEKRLTTLAALAQSQSRRRQQRLDQDRTKAQAQIDDFVTDLKDRARVVTTREQLASFNNQKRIAEKEIALIASAFNEKSEKASAADQAAFKGLDTSAVFSTNAVNKVFESETRKLTDIQNREQSNVSKVAKDVTQRIASFNTAATGLSRDIKSESDRIRFDATVARGIATSNLAEAKLLAASGQLTPSESRTLVERATRLETQAEALARFTKQNPDLKGEIKKTSREFEQFTKDFAEFTEAIRLLEAGAPAVLIDSKGRIVKGPPPPTAKPTPTKAVSPAEFNKFKNRLNRTLAVLQKNNSLGFEADGSFALTKTEAEGVFQVIDEAVVLSDDLTSKLEVPLAVPSGPDIEGLQTGNIITVSPGRSIKEAGELAEKWLEKNAGTGTATAFTILAKPEGVASLVLIVLATGQAALVARSGGRVVIRGLGATVKAAKTSEKAVRDLIRAARVLGPQRLALAPISPLLTVPTGTAVGKTGLGVLRQPTITTIPATKPLLSGGDLNKVFRSLNRSFQPAREASAAARATSQRVNRQIAKTLRAIQKASRDPVRARKGTKAIAQAEIKSFDFVGADQPGFVARLSQSRAARAEAITQARATQQSLTQAVAAAKAEVKVISANPALAASPALDAQLRTVVILETALARSAAERKALSVGSAQALASLVQDPTTVEQLQVSIELEKLQAAAPAAVAVASPLAVPGRLVTKTKLRQLQPIAVPKTLEIPGVTGLRIPSKIELPSAARVQAPVGQLELISQLEAVTVKARQIEPEAKTPTPVKGVVAVKIEAPVKKAPPAEKPVRPPKAPKPPKPPEPPKPPKLKAPKPPTRPPKFKAPEEPIRKRRRLRFPRVSLGGRSLNVPTGKFPKVIVYRQGIVERSIDLTTGKRAFGKDLSTKVPNDPTITPQESLAVETVSPNKPKVREANLSRTVSFRLSKDGRRIDFFGIRQSKGLVGMPKSRGKLLKGQKNA